MIYIKSMDTLLSKSAIIGIFSVQDDKYEIRWTEDGKYMGQVIGKDEFDKINHQYEYSIQSEIKELSEKLRQIDISLSDIVNK